MPIIVALPGPSVAPVDEVQKKPRFMMATLISRSQAECFSWSGERTMFVHFLKALRTRWFDKIRRRLPSCPEWIQLPTMVGGPGGVGKAISKSFVNSTEVVSAATSPRSTIEITCHQNCTSFLAAERRSTK